MEKLKEVIKNELHDRIKAMESSINSAKLCLDDDDFLQSAVRLQDAAKQAEFDTLLMSVFDAASGGA